MSYFRNLNQVVSSQLFTKPNNLLLPGCFRPVYLEVSHIPNVEYLHTSQSLLATIEQLESLRSSNSSYD